MKKEIKTSQKINKTNKKFLMIPAIALVLILIALIYFFANYEISFNFGGSREFKRLADLTSTEYYMKNSILVAEGSGCKEAIEGNKLDNKILVDLAYLKSRDGGKARVINCYDNKEKIAYTWYQIDDKDYVRYNNGINEIYRLYNLSENFKQYDRFVPDLNVYKDYNPTLLYNNVPTDGVTLGHEEVYKMKLKDNKFYKEVLSKFIDKEYLGKYIYLKIYINEMNLVTSQSISVSEYGDTYFGPFTYEYYYDKSYDLNDLYEYVDSNNDVKDKITISFIDYYKDKVVDSIELAKGENLMIENGKWYEVFFDRDCKENFNDYQSKFKEGILIDNIFNENIDLYVKEK